jgi:hypothetical protein
MSLVTQADPSGGIKIWHWVDWAALPERFSVETGDLQEAASVEG